MDVYAQNDTAKVNLYDDIPNLNEQATGAKECEPSTKYKPHFSPTQFADYAPYKTLDVTTHDMPSSFPSTHLETQPMEENVEILPSYPLVI